MRLTTARALLAAAALLAIARPLASVGETGMRSLYKTESGRAKALESYDRAMGLWTVPYSDDWVDTAYGRTHVVVSGPEDGAPLFLLPGLFADATMWYANAGALAERYGSWLALALARATPERIAAMVLLDPCETFVPMDGGIAWKGFWSFAFFPTRAKYAAFFDWMGGGYSDPAMDIWFEHMLDVVELGSTKMTQVPQQRGVLGPEALTMADMPVLIMSGGKPILYKDPAQFAAAAAKALPRAEIEIVPDSGHGLNMEKPEQVNGRILAFLAANY